MARRAPRGRGRVTRSTAVTFRAGGAAGEPLRGIAGERSVPTAGLDVEDHPDLAGNGAHDVLGLLCGADTALLVVVGRVQQASGARLVEVAAKLRVAKGAGARPGASQLY